jgi:hypothetical protein
MVEFLSLANSHSRISGSLHFWTCRLDYLNYFRVPSVMIPTRDSFHPPFPLLPLLTLYPKPAFNPGTSTPFPFPQPLVIAFPAQLPSISHFSSRPAPGLIPFSLEARSRACYHPSYPCVVYQISSCTAVCEV